MQMALRRFRWSKFLSQQNINRPAGAALSSLASSLPTVSSGGDGGRSATSSDEISLSGPNKCCFPNETTGRPGWGDKKESAPSPQVRLKFARILRLAPSALEAPACSPPPLSWPDNLDFSPPLIHNSSVETAALNWPKWRRAQAALISRSIFCSCSAHFRRVGLRLFGPKVCRREMGSEEGEMKEGRK